MHTPGAPATLPALESWPRSRIARGFAAALTNLPAPQSTALRLPPQPPGARFADTSIRSVLPATVAGAAWTTACGWCRRAERIIPGATRPAAGP